METLMDHDAIMAEWARMHAAKAEALEAFNEAKFGMFIHWGLYAEPGGVWKGQRMEVGGVGPGVAEWIMRRKSIPRDEYAKMDSSSPTCVSDAPNDWDPSPRSFDDYMQNKALPQIAELAERYPDLFLVWFDGAGFIPEKVSFDFYRTLYGHAPGALVNSRLSRDDLPDKLCDYQSAGDNHIPDPDELKNPYWETCGTMNNSWGFKRYDHDWKCPLEVLSWLVDVVSRGGNYLLNVGPDGHGEIPSECVSILRQVGDWLRVNGEAIYGTRAWTVSREGPTVVSRKGTGKRAAEGFGAAFSAEDFWFTKKVNAVYAIALAYPEGRKVLIRSFKDAPVTAVRMLGSEEAVAWEMTPEGLQVMLPAPASENGFALAIEMAG